MPTPRTRTLALFLLCASIVAIPRALDAQESATPARRTFPNPYFDATSWKVWRDDPSPVSGVVSQRAEGKETKTEEVTLRLLPPEERTFPGAFDPNGPCAVFTKAADEKTAGLWDDVYASWSGLHGYVRSRWMGNDGSKVDVRGQLVHFVDVKKSEMLRAGVNFVHQSTTGMGHAISNGVVPERTLAFEKLYFADLLVTAPAHASFTEDDPNFTKDLYVAHVPTLFHSVGSSDSETMAITKLAIAGAHLPPATKLTLKRHGLYPSALLYLWKAALPVDVPYDHELRHRIAYKAVGDRHAYPERYGAAGIERGDRSLAYHQYDDTAHVRAMIALARALEDPPPEALFEVLAVEGGKEHYALRKSAVVLQRENETVRVRVSTRDSYDVDAPEPALHWRLLYGNDRTRVTKVPEAPGEWIVEVPWNPSLPEGRTAIGLFAHDGKSHGNPAILTVYRQKGELPPSGHGPGDYAFPSTHANRRPILLDFQDAFFRKGRESSARFRAIDPEGFPVTFHLRGAEGLELDGNELTWRPPRDAAGESREVTLILSDGTSGNGYSGQNVTLHLEEPDVFARIDAVSLVAKAPATLSFTGRNSIGRRLRHGWHVSRAGEGGEAPAFEELPQGREFEHTFQEPGIHEVSLTVKSGDVAHTARVRVYVHASTGEHSPTEGRLQVRHRGIRLGEPGRAPSPFDGTYFSTPGPSGSSVHRFTLHHLGGEGLTLDRRAILIEGEGAAHFQLVAAPRRRLGPLDSTAFEIRYRARAAGEHHALVRIVAGDSPLTFPIAGVTTGS